MREKLRRKSSYTYSSQTTTPKSLPYTQRTPRKKKRRKASTCNPFIAMRNEIGREGKEETHQIFYQKVEEKERKKMMSKAPLELVSKAHMQEERGWRKKGESYSSCEMKEEETKL